MSEWFRSLPHALDSVANTAKFQQESLYSLINFYQRRCAAFTATIARLRAERNALKRELQEARQDNDRIVLHYNQEHGAEPAPLLNSNGKRPMTEVRRTSNSVKTSSSPRSTMTPNRLTLPPGQHPTFTRHPNENNAQPSNNISGYLASSHEPNRSNSHFIQQYSYNEDQSLPQGPQDMSMQASDQMQRSLMPPPPVPLPSHRQRGFKPATQSHSMNMDASAGSSRQGLDQSTTRSHGRMGPPSTPRGLPQFQARTQQTPSSRRMVSTPCPPGNMQNNTNHNLGAPNLMDVSSNRFFPPSSSHGRHAYNASTAQTGNSTRFTRFDPAPRNAAPGPNGRTSQGSQRMPFIPGGSGGFG
ncbi:hypothetical protein SERLA73DRAFT_78911 [Serpula lacrymans var. lacrymans S7.3]|uniref:Uncharacterized protein n=2 Tax=Serpula lacrymans var. lacrymans TaxID=341189 RepID=F8QEQ0_SERL3|nr:uncharacterized protein SERLADRAFT_444022 [Serpula lacrymans var. lacrymans S7.9]EGN93306.1 hypothetical protein SERLA73DRAFT_78911 [Serpula lacrymans var. lacrymans S7.3]EGO18683.1 hypothetical protein SERLADRAFT_444022 [Serpula lacrymans var. lacrymans S7.9]